MKTFYRIARATSPAILLAFAACYDITGLSLDLILQRKEMERVAGGGLFFWGVGTSLARKFVDLLKVDGCEYQIE